MDMRPRRATIIFDTSALNAIADETASPANLGKLSAQFNIRLTETNLAEVGSTSRAERREQVLALCRRLGQRGECIKPYNWIIEELAKDHFRYPSIFDWRNIPLRSRAIEKELASGGFLGKQDTAEAMRDDAKSSDDEFKALFKEARDNVGLSPSARELSLDQVVDILTSDGGALWKTGIGFYSRATGKELTETEIKEFIETCPPFHAMLLSIGVAQYHGSVRDLKASAQYGAGRLDLFASTYLPYCDQFITEDKRQLNALSAVASKANLETRVRPYAEFREHWLR
jgi:hypothetical protein